MSTLHQKRQKFASVLEKACQQSASPKSSNSSSDSVFSPDQAGHQDSSPDCCEVSPSWIQWHGSTPATPLLDSFHSLNWPTTFLGSDISCSSQLSPCIDGDSWPSDSSFSCPWNPGTDIEFLEADTADRLLSQAMSGGQEVTQTSMDLLDFLDDQSHTISHLGECMDMDNPLFTGADNPEYSPMFTDLQLDLKTEGLKSDTWMNDPMTSDSDLDDLFKQSSSVETTSNHAWSSGHHPSYLFNDASKGLSTSDYFQRVADRVTKKRHLNPTKDISPAELLFRKERNRLRSKAYRLRRKMQYESMKKEVIQARQKIQEVQKQMQNS